MSDPVLVRVDDAWIGHWTGPTVLEVDANGARQAPNANDADDVVDLGGTLLPGFRDAHVHLMLVQLEDLADSPLTQIDDLGAPLEAALGWQSRDDARLPDVRVAGPFLTAAGGYPFGRSWAADGSARAVSAPAAGGTVVDELAAAGVDHIKIALHDVAEQSMPTLETAAAAAIADRAHARGLTVIAHTEGPGQACSALAAGADVLAHTPWTELLEDALLDEMANTGMAWISTLDIHGWGDRDGEFREPYETARENLRRFAALGGTVHYGTDLGNGPLPVGLNEREIEALVDAGLSAAQIASALCATSATGDRIAGPMVRIALPRPSEPRDLPAWFGAARRWEAASTYPSHGRPSSHRVGRSHA